ncbi:TPA: hypothetical protein ACH3X1_015970 [Trebouxia sp. C0004]
MIRDRTGETRLFYCVVLFLSVTVRGAPAKLPTTSSFLQEHCDSYIPKYLPLVSSMLGKYRLSGLLITDILSLHGWEGSPQVIMVNGTLLTISEPHLNVAANLIPLLVKLSSRVRLPDLALAGDIMDQPEDDISRHGGPWFGYCNMMFQTTNLMYPAGSPVEEPLSCGTKCTPFTRKDTREPKAVFLGSSTGWLSGRRTAVVSAGILHPEHVYSGYTALIDIGQDIRDSQHPTLEATKPPMSLAKQVQRFKYIINVDGHCAALRMRELLASDSVVLWVESNEVEWYYSLLQPFVHYIPVRYFPHMDDPLSDIVTKIEWANANPAEMALIIQNAHEFALQHFSEHGMTCYSVQLVNEYAALFPDQWKLQKLQSEGAFAHSLKHFEPF